MDPVPHDLRHRMERQAPRDDDPESDRLLREHQHLGDRRPRQAQGAAARRSRRSRQQRLPPHELLGTQAQQSGVHSQGGHGLRRRQRQCQEGRADGQPVPRPAPRRDQPRSPGLRRQLRSAPAGLTAPRRYRRGGSGSHWLRARRARKRALHPAADGHRAAAHPRGHRPPRTARPRSQGMTLHPALSTRATELFGVQYPIVQTGMGWVSDAHLTAATANAGGLGIIAGGAMSYEELAAAISGVQELTEKPFGVNLRADSADISKRIDLVIQAGVKVASFALAPKQDLIGRLKDAGLVVMPSIGARRHAEKVAAWGADAVLVQGGEGGGHTGNVPTSLLLPQVVDAVDIPVIAAGGYFDGRGLVSALAYGAEGIAMGTRFLLTSDSPVASSVKDVY